MLSVVWQHSKNGGNALLMMLAIADFADDRGYAYPSVNTLAAKCRVKPRAANYTLAQLQESGELSVQYGKGPKGTNVYRIKLDAMGLQQPAPLQPAAPLQPIASLQPCAPLQSTAATPATGCAKPLQPVAPKPSLNHQEPSDSSPKRSRASESNPKGTRLPADWVLPKAWGEWAVECGWSAAAVRSEAAKFRDYWHAKPGKDGRKSDWFATWRNWLRRAIPPAGSSVAYPESAASWWETQAGIEAKGVELGVGPWDQLTQWHPYRQKVFDKAGFDPSNPSEATANNNQRSFASVSPGAAPETPS